MKASKIIIYFLFSICLIFPVVMTSAYGAITDNILAYYKMDNSNATSYESSSVIPDYTLRNITYIDSQGGIINSARGVYSASKYFANCSFPIQNNSYNTTVNLWFNSTGYSPASIGQGLFTMGKYSGVESALVIMYWDTSIYVLAAGSTSICLRNMNTTIGNWSMITTVTNSSDKRVTTYFNGVACNTSNPSSDKPTLSANSIYIGNARSNLCGAYGSDLQPATKTIIDEVGIWNRSLDIAEIGLLYANGSGLAYPFTNIPPSYRINLSQLPLDINASYFGGIQINGTVNNISGANITAVSYMELFYTLNTSIVNGGCSIFYGRNCAMPKDYSLFNMTKIDNTNFTYTITDNLIFPSIYPFNESIIDNNPIRYNYTVYNNNNIQFRMYNFSSWSSEFFVMVEFNAKNDSSTSPNLEVYYCNDSYISDNPASNSNCQFITSYAPSDNNHIHNYSKHKIIPTIIKTVGKTTNSSILFIGKSNTAANGWDFEYVLNNAYDNMSFITGNYNSWSLPPSENMIFDMHVHQYLSTDKIQYYAKFNDGSGFSNNSIIYYDYYNLSNFAPSGVRIVNPNCSLKISVSHTLNATVYFNWTSSIDANNDTIKYQVGTYDTSGLFDSSVSNWLENTSNFTWSTNANYSADENYYACINSCDSFGLCTQSCESCTYRLCENTWLPKINPCTGGAKLIDYYDSSYCPEQYDIPSNNGTYSECSLNTTVVNEGTITHNIDTTLFIIIILLIMIIVTLRIGIMNEGYIKSILSFTGVLIIAFAIIWRSYVMQSTSISVDAVFTVANVLSGLFFLIGVALVIFGLAAIVSHWKTNRKQHK